jgi:hypothetical protein
MLIGAIEKLESQGEIKLWRPLEAHQGIKRCLWISKGARAAIDGFVASEGAKRAAALAQDLNRFATGRLLRVTDDLKRLKPPENEIWELRSQSPKPAFRLLGAFAARDDFVVLQAAPRGSYDAKGAWKAAVGQARDEWDRLFPGHRRLKGTVLSDYVTNTIPDGTGPVPG